jgi:hypothetical protein
MAKIVANQRHHGSERFEPWLGGDRQKAGGVAKMRDPFVNGQLV